MLAQMEAAILYRAWQGETPAAIAEACSCPPETVANVLQTMRERLARRNAAGRPGKVAIDLTGERFGRLTVLGRAPKPSANGSAGWLARCDCGTKIVALSSRLRAGRIRSCGCLRAEMGRELFMRGHAAQRARVEDLTGRRFGRLLVVKRVADSISRWQCLCDCGESRTVEGKKLRRGEIKSCGCLRSDCARKAVKLATAAASCKRKKRAAVKAPPRLAPARAGRGYTLEEQATLEAAIAAGKVTRIKNGEWPDAGRESVNRWRLTPAARAKMGKV